MTNPSQSVHDYDVVVVGGGIAGVSAAVAAAEGGARVVLLDRASEDEPGGNTRYTEAFLRMESLSKTSEGFEDALVGDFMGHPDPGIVSDAALPFERRSAISRGTHTIDPDYVTALAENAPKALAWQSEHGVRFDFLPTPFLTQSTTRMAPVGGGRAIVETMGRSARRLGVDFRFETTARRLLTGPNGVYGVEAHAEDGSLELHGRVVLASGGYQGNNELMARYHGAHALTCRPVARGGHYNKGEGLEMALAIGAGTAGNFSLFHAEPIDPRSAQPEAAIFCFPYGILVNKRGERFTDEARGPVDAWYERTTREIQDQPDGVAWIVLDQQALSVPNFGSSVRTDIPPMTAPTFEELATKIGVPSDTLMTTVTDYNAACSTGAFDHSAVDGVTTVGLRPAKSNWARPLTEAPLVAYPIMAAVVFTFGGLKTTAKAEVVDTDGRVIPGLYAAGELTGLYYSNYTGSTSVLRGATFGRIAGIEAATSINPTQTVEV